MAEVPVWVPSMFSWGLRYREEIMEMAVMQSLEQKYSGGKHNVIIAYMLMRCLASKLMLERAVLQSLLKIILGFHSDLTSQLIIGS